MAMFYVAQPNTKSEIYDKSTKSGTFIVDTKEKILKISGILDRLRVKS